ncbi:MAG: type III-A CRISPR-associated protein Cas10/Csm1 [Deltaproteobacteria bacterium HGW-Deltaproteobacteria-15]|jgi:CRISPR-associated protein Csm1|nr:MAG: type III-A CRISPR-associated protein Cas10/Csm1 [Deltaproteobacteria bacterium HGW-Deltaproteobacteria-15]
MSFDLETAIMGALLHDIGKFAQRAGWPYSNGVNGDYRKGADGHTANQHALFTHGFIEKDLILPLEVVQQRAQIASVASAHHNPDESNLMEMAVCVADRLSAGTDITEKEDLDEFEHSRETRLISGFHQVELARNQFVPPGDWHHKLVHLESGSEVVFPQKGVPKGSPDEYQRHFSEFLTGIRSLDQNLPFHLYLDALVSLLERFTWCVPSDTYTLSHDVSLFDHSFSSAGIAQAIFAFHAHKNLPLRWEDEQDKALVVSGDLSGIQDYIFGISKSSGRGVSKIFRARSFYLQSLTRSVILTIEKRLGLYSVDRLMDSGGKFILIVPLLASVLNELARISEELEDWFRRKFKGLLTMNLTWSTRLNQTDFLMKGFKSKLDEVNDARDAAKFFKLRNSLDKMGPVLNEDYDDREGGNCTLCGINVADADATRRYDEKGLDASICSDCAQQILDLGKDLPTTEYLVYGDKGTLRLAGGIMLSLLRDPPSDFSGIREVGALSDTARFGRARIAKHLPVLTEKEISDKRWTSLFKKLEGEIEIKAGQPKTFGMIALKSMKEYEGELIGRDLLAFLKADVDNMGLIFSMGVREKLSVARFAFLSRMLNFFFSDYLPEIVRSRYPDIYVVFSGGDDLFFVGPWWQTIDFALFMRKSFSNFCAENQDITFSAGIRLARPKLPMRKAAELAEEDLKKAKQHIEKGGMKDHVTLLGEMFSWAELEELKNLGERLDRAVKESKRTKFSTAFLYRLLEYHRMYRRFLHGGEIKFGRYLALAHYDIGRNIQYEKEKDKPRNQEEIDLLYKVFCVGVSERPLLDKLNIPLFYAITLNRKGE